MKLTHFILSALVATSFGSFAFADQQTPTPKTKEVVVSISEVYVPGGFDSNTEAFVVASGVFPNGCYQWSEAKIENKDNNVIEVTATAKVTQGMCIMVLVPFNKEIRLGRLSKGEHTLRFINGDGTFLEKTITVE
jgi:hypothetical protein